MSYLKIIYFILLGFFLNSCSNYPEASSVLVDMDEIVGSASIKKIEANSYVKLYLQPLPAGETGYKVNLEVNEDQTANMNVAVEGDTLKITHTGKFSKLKLSASVQIPDIDTVSLTEHAQVNFYEIGDTRTRKNWDTLFENKNFTLNLSDWADFDDRSPNFKNGVFNLNTTSYYSYSNKLHYLDVENGTINIKSNPSTQSKIKFQSSYRANYLNIYDTKESTIDLKKLRVNTAKVNLYRSTVTIYANNFDQSQIKYMTILNVNKSCNTANIRNLTQTNPGKPEIRTY